MTADTITIGKLADLATLLDLSAASMRRLHQSAIDGDVGPQEAAAEVAEIIASINAFQS